MPDAIEDDPSKEIIDIYDILLSTVKTLLTHEEVKALIGLFPKDGMYGVECKFLRLVEFYFIKISSSFEYRNLISACPFDEWKDSMQVRLNNWEKKMKK